MLLLLLLAWAGWTLTRLGRLEDRVARAWTALDAQLQRRAGLAEELARNHPAAVGERPGRLPRGLRGGRPRAGRRRPGAGRERRSAASCGNCRPTCRACRRPCGPTSPARPRGSRWPGGSTTTPSATPGRCAAAGCPRLLRLHARRPLPRYFDIDDRLVEVTEQRAAAAVSPAAEPPYDERALRICPSIRRQHPVATADPLHRHRHRRVKRGMAEQLKGGVIMDVVTPEQAKIAEDAGAVAVMALERVPADIRVAGRHRPHERPRHDRRASSPPSRSR